MLSEWTPGETPTRTECPHGVVIATGTYQREQVPTGDHPECWDRFQDGLQEEAQAHEDALRAEYDAMIWEGLWH